MASVSGKAKSARQASYALAKAQTKAKDRALTILASELLKRKGDILKANAKDLALAKGRIPDALYKRLQLDEAKILGMASGVRAVSKLGEPVGKTQYAMELDRGLTVYRISVPIGVIGVVFESRPDALVQISALCLKSGNSVILKGGSEAKNTNLALYNIIRQVSESHEIPKGWIQMVESRQEIAELLKLDGLVDLMIPRGSNEFVKHIKENTKIPVLGHAAGVCHVYVDAKADMVKALDVVYDAKLQYPAVCNAMETLLVHKSVAKRFLPKIWGKLSAQGVGGKGDASARKILKGLGRIRESDWDVEYNDLYMNFGVVSSLEDAVKHINVHGSRHTDAIVTEDKKAAKTFIESVDSSSVMWNASTRFADGFRYGLGAEVGISTNKIHARGPVGLDGLTTQKWVLIGRGQMVGSYKNRRFTHRKLDRKFEIR